MCGNLSRMPSLIKSPSPSSTLLPPHRPPLANPLKAFQRQELWGSLPELFLPSPRLSPAAPIFTGLPISKVGIFWSLSRASEQMVHMVRFLLAFLVAAHITATAVVVAAGRPLHDAAPPARAAELVHVAEGGAAPLSSVGVSLHGSALKIAAGPAAGLRHHRHKPFDNSIVGAEVILGGLAIAVIAAVFCYIRVTRSRSQEDKS